MYITFDYKCPDCTDVDSRMVKREEMDRQYCRVCTPGSRRWRPRMLRLPAGTRTTFRFNDRKLKR